METDKKVTTCTLESRFLLSRLLDEENIEIAKKIQPTNWEISKIEAIDFTKPFLSEKLGRSGFSKKCRSVEGVY